MSLLNAKNYTINTNEQSSSRAAEVFQYIKSNYTDHISLEKIASVANMTVPSFCRYFKKMNNKTFTKFLNEYRIIEACKLLSESNYTINEISVRVGFNNIAHFNRHFKLLTNSTPTAYRAQLIK